MKPRTLIVAAAASMFALSLPVYAAGDKASKDDSKKEFSQLDKNKDGYISRNEAKGSEHEKDFAKYDKNHDGKLSKREFGAAEKAETSSSGSSTTK